jgi:hypothetical protein
LVKQTLVYATVLIAVMGAVLALALGSFLQQPSNRQTSDASPTLPASSSASFQVLKTDATVPFDAECLVLEDTGHTCPTVSAGDNGTNASPMRNAELVSFQGTRYYYAGNFSAGFTGPPGSHDIWFTNSTIFCVTPSLDSYATCPANENLPQVSW